MKLPGGDRAIVDEQKLVGYCLDPEHPRGKHKARAFNEALGLTIRDAHKLRDALLAAAASADVQPGNSDEYGDRYLIDFEVAGPRGLRTVRSAWILRRGENAPRLTTCYVK